MSRLAVNMGRFAARPLVEELQTASAEAHRGKGL